jgi:hypothetical protein
MPVNEIEMVKTDEAWECRVCLEEKTGTMKIMNMQFEQDDRAYVVGFSICTKCIFDSRTDWLQEQHQRILDEAIAQLKEDDDGMD